MVESGSLKEYVVKTIVGLINELDIDGETMQDILEEVGMDEQMHRQLIMSNPVEDTLELVNEKIPFEKGFGYQIKYSYIQES